MIIRVWRQLEINCCRCAIAQQQMIFISLCPSPSLIFYMFLIACFPLFYIMIQFLDHLTYIVFLYVLFVAILSFFSSFFYIHTKGTREWSDRTFGLFLLVRCHYCHIGFLSNTTIVTYSTRKWKKEKNY